MKPELRAKIIAFNKLSAERLERSADMDIIVSALVKLPPGQLNKFLSDEVIAVLKKYGLTAE